MQILECAGTIAQTSGVPSCSGTWAPSPAVFTIHDGVTLGTAICTILVLAGAFRMIRKFLWR